MTAEDSKPQPRGVPLADTDEVLRTVLYPSDTLDKKGNRGIQSNAFRPMPSEEEETRGLLKIGGWISVWEGSLTTAAQAASLTTNDARRYVVRLSVAEIRALRYPGEDHPLFDVFWDPRPECVAADGFESRVPGDLGHCGLSGLAVLCVEPTVTDAQKKAGITGKAKSRIVRKQLLDLADRSPQERVGAP